GVNVITIGTGNSQTHVPHYASMTTQVRQWGVAPTYTDSPARGRFAASSVGGASVGGSRPDAPAAGALAVSVWPSAANPLLITGAMMTSVAGGVWLDLHVPEFDNLEVENLMTAVIRYMRGCEEV